MPTPVTVPLVIVSLFAGFGVTEVTGDTQDDAFKKELKAMAGTWRTISAESDGTNAPEDVLKENIWTRAKTARWS
jgi:hypothetical protein